MRKPTKNFSLVAAFLSALFLVGCNAGGETGDPNVGAAPGPPASTLGNKPRPGQPGGTPLKAPPARDPMGGRGGAAAGQ